MKNKLPEVDLHIAAAIKEIAIASGDSEFTERYCLLLETVAARFAEERRSGVASDLVIFVERLIRQNKFSFAQLFQDLWVLHETLDKRSGFFVEFGAADGVEFSNTYLLEKYYGWSGILAEPNPKYWNLLAKNRTSNISKKCVFPGPGARQAFRCTSDGHFSTLTRYVNEDPHGKDFRSSDFNEIEVETVSLENLLLEFAAPVSIDYLSIDTEGSELVILEEFPFECWDIKIISVEHNYTENRDKITKLLESKGYKRKFSGLLSVGRLVCKAGFDGN